MTTTNQPETATAKTREIRTPKRDDIHRPGMVNPSEYKHLISFSFPGVSGSPGYNMGMLSAIRTGEPQAEPIYGAGMFDEIARVGTTTEPKTEPEPEPESSEPSSYPAELDHEGEVWVGNVESLYDLRDYPTDEDEYWRQEGGIAYPDAEAEMEARTAECARAEAETAMNWI